MVKGVYPSTPPPHPLLSRRLYLEQEGLLPECVPDLGLNLTDGQPGVQLLGAAGVTAQPHVLEGRLLRAELNNFLYKIMTI